MVLPALFMFAVGDGAKDPASLPGAERILKNEFATKRIHDCGQKHFSSNNDRESVWKLPADLPVIASRRVLKKHGKVKWI